MTVNQQTKTYFRLVPTTWAGILADVESGIDVDYYVEGGATDEKGNYPSGGRDFSSKTLGKDGRRMRLTKKARAKVA